MQILLTALLVCVSALGLGQAALRICGAPRWSWLAPPVGLCVLILLAVPAHRVPGGQPAVAVLIAVLTVAAGFWCLRDPDQRPSLGGLAAAAPVALLALIPFAANGRGGILGVSFNNDMAAHMLLVEAYMSDAVERISPLLADYPLGPHALVSVLAGGLGVRVDEAFAGLIVALPILIAWSALALLRSDTRWLYKPFVATVVGMPFLVAAYYAQGAFKEVMQAGLVLALALLLTGYGPVLDRLRWVPVALLLAGIVSVFSLAGLPWPVAFLGLWLVGQAIVRLRVGGLALVWADLRAALPSVAIGAAALLVLLIPQLRRLERFVALRDGTGIRVDDIGNLAGPLPGWEAFGVWTTPDFRFPASFGGGMLTAFVFALVLLGTYWAFRRGRWMLPLAAGAALLIWWVSAESQSPYVAAKALVIASPILLALAVLPLVDRGPQRPPWWSVAPLLAALLALFVGVSDVRALRIAQVGPVDHADELRSLRATVGDEPLLYLAHDDFVRWELAGTPVGTPQIDLHGAYPIRPAKHWTYGQAVDFDSVDAAAYNAHDWILTTRDAAASAPPAGLRLERQTPNYSLWHRTRPVRQRKLLAEGPAAGAVLDCDTRRGRAIAATSGVAAVRTPPVTVPGPAVAPGADAAAEIPLDAGTWDLVAAYTSPLPLTVSAPGLSVELPANLDRPGPRWPIGRVTTTGTAPLTLTFATDRPALGPASAVAVVAEVTAVKAERPRTVPLRRACGFYVDWYRTD